jgi:hypothetical protein
MVDSVVRVVDNTTMDNYVNDDMGSTVISSSVFVSKATRGGPSTSKLGMIYVNRLFPEVPLHTPPRHKNTHITLPTQLHDSRH